MPTYTALTTTTGQQAAEALAAGLERMNPAPVGIGTFEIEDGSGLWEVGGYFLDRPNDIELTLLTAACRGRRRLWSRKCLRSGLGR